MEHIDWLNSDNIVVVRTNLIIDTFLDDIRNEKCQQLRIISWKKVYYIRYKIRAKVYWYEVFLHKKDSNYYLTPKLIEDKKFKDKINRKYLAFNRDWVINEILN
jgi:hypothetical protein